MDTKKIEKINELLVKVHTKQNEGEHIGAWSTIAHNLGKIKEMFETNRFTPEGRRAVDMSQVLRYLNEQTGGQDPILRQLHEIDETCQSYGKVKIDVHAAEEMLQNHLGMRP